MGWSWPPLRWFRRILEASEEGIASISLLPTSSYAGCILVISLWKVVLESSAKCFSWQWADMDMKSTCHMVNYVSQACSVSEPGLLYYCNSCRCQNTREGAGYPPSPLNVSEQTNSLPFTQGYPNSRFYSSSKRRVRIFHTIFAV